MKSKGGRPRKLPEESSKIHILIPDEVLDGYEAWVKDLHATVPGGEAITAHDLMRSALTKVLRAYQAEKRRPRKR